nr:protein translocase subunit SecD [Bacteroidales bacterium]
MQNKGAIKTLAIIFGLIFLYQLSFTVVTKVVEKRAAEFAQGDEAKENYYLDSVSNVNVYNLLVKKYTYRDAKEREINLGLDLKGGMNVTLEVSVKDIVKALAGANANDPYFQQAMQLATERQEKSEGDFVTLFGQAYQEVAPAGSSLASIFLYEFKDNDISINSTNDEVLKVLKQETDGAIDRSYQILRTRIDRFGVAQPNIQKLEGSGRILVELPGIKDPARVRKLLQGTAQLEFWETYNFSEIYQYFDQANTLIAQKNKDQKALAEGEVVEEVAPEAEATEALEAQPAEGEELAVADTTASLLDQIAQDSTNTDNLSDDEAMAKAREANPLYFLLQPSYTQQGPANTARVGMAQVKDTAAINRMLNVAAEENIFPRTMKLAWTVKPESYGDEAEYLELVALKMSRDNKCALGGEVITDARQDYGQSNQVEVTLQMNSEGTKAWKRLTGENVGKQIAIVLDNYVYSYPVVNDEIPNGRSSISGGGMSIEEAQDLANILKAGKLPAPARILEEQVVGPSLGKESVQKGMWSMVFAFLLVLVYMVFFYNKAGLVADIALLVNVFFLFGVLACLGSVLTLPGIAGIVLTLGMAVDSNVIIFE